MKFNTLVASVFLAVIGATSATAQVGNVTLTLNGPNVTSSTSNGDTLYTYTFPAGVQTGTANFNGTITNSTSTTYVYDGSSYTPNPLVGGITESDYISSTLNTITSAPGIAGIVNQPSILDFTIPTAQSSLDSGCIGPNAPTPLAGSILCGFFNLSSSGAAAGDPNANIGAWYDVVPGAVTVIPEPGVVALFASSLLSGGLLLRRRK